MLSVTQTAKKLNISGARVRKMIADGVIHAEKVGSAWSIPESEVAYRLENAPKAGRPKEDDLINEDYKSLDLHDVYVALKHGNFARPSATTIAMMQDKNEAGFLLCVCDYFLNLKQREEIEEGVY